MSVVKTEDIRALGISLQLQLAKSGTVVFQTHVHAEASISELDALLDKLCAVARRREAMERLPEVQAALEEREAALAGLVARLDEVDREAQAAFYEKGKRGEWNPEKDLTPSQRSARMAAEQSRKTFAETEIPQLKREIAMLERQIRRDAVHSRTNSVPGEPAG